MNFAAQVGHFIELTAAGVSVAIRVANDDGDKRPAGAKRPEKPRKWRRGQVYDAGDGAHTHTDTAGIHVFPGDV